MKRFENTELDRLKQLEGISNEREEEIQMLQTQRAQAMQDAAEARAAKEQVPLPPPVARAREDRTAAQGPSPSLNRPAPDRPSASTHPRPQLERAIKQYERLLDALGIEPIRIAGAVQGLDRDPHFQTTYKASAALAAQGLGKGPLADSFGVQTGEGYSGGTGYATPRGQAQYGPGGAAYAPGGVAQQQHGPGGAPYHYGEATTYGQSSYSVATGAPVAAYGAAGAAGAAAAAAAACACTDATACTQPGAYGTEAGEQPGGVKGFLQNVARIFGANPDEDFRGTASYDAYPGPAPNAMVGVGPGCGALAAVSAGGDETGSGYGASQSSGQLVASPTQAVAPAATLATAGAKVLPALPQNLVEMEQFMLLTDEGAVTVRARASGTLAYLKRMIAIQLYLSPRLSITITAAKGGEPLRDDVIIAPCAPRATEPRRRPLSCSAG